MSNIAALLQAAEYIEMHQRSLINWQDLPDELILKILSYSEVIDLISCGEVSKRTRNISYDSSLWAMANFEEKIVKTELLELILSKGCKILNISNSKIVGSWGSNIKSQLRVLNLSQFNPGFPNAQVNYEENIDALEALLFSCCSLQHLKLKCLRITPKMAVSICKNGNTLQTLHLNHSFIDESSYPLYIDYNVHVGNFEAIIKSCQELKEVDLNFLSNKPNYVEGGLTDDRLEFLAKNITPNVETLKLRNHDFLFDHFKTLLSRLKKIKTLSLEAYYMTDDSLRYIRQYLNLTLEELSLADDGVHNNIDRTRCISFSGLLELKSMPKLKVLKLYNTDNYCEGIQNLRQHLPHIKISGHICAHLH